MPVTPTPRVLVACLLGALATAACGGGGGGGSSPAAPAPLPPSADTAPPGFPGLIAAVGDASSIAVHLRPAAAGLEVGLFVDTDPANLFSGSPAVVDPAGTIVVLTAPSTGSHRVGLAVRSSAAEPWRPSGPALEVLVAPPLYVDPLAAPGGDGASPAMALSNPVAALVFAAAGGGNVWLRGGDYGVASLPLFDGVFLSGGFDAGFDMATRDPAGFPSVVRGASGQVIVGVSGSRAVIDGLVLEGDGVANVGVDSEEADLDLRSVVVRGCDGRGIRVRAPLVGAAVEIQVAGCTIEENGGDGLSALGVLDLDVFASRFVRNAQEGLDLDDLVAPPGGKASLSVTASVFESNGSEGLDVDLAASGSSTTVGGAFDVSIRDSLFVSNNLDGLLVDIDYEAQPAWSLDLEVVGAVARGNRGSGARFDLDSSATTFVHRSAFGGNAGDGLRVTSESAPGLAVVSTSAFVGNLGAGMRATFGSVPVLASHCVLSGNGVGGLRSETVTSTAASVLAWLQPQVFSGVSDVGTAVAAAGDLQNVAQAFTVVQGTSGAAPVVGDSAVVILGVDAELAGDQVARTVVGIDAAAIELDPAPTFVAIPSPLALFDVGTGVSDDHRLVPGSTVAGDGMVAPGASAVDPGPHGAPDAGEPGPVGPLGNDTFRLVRATPPAIGALQPSALLVLEFDRAVLGASVDDTSVRVVDGAGATLVPTLAVVDGAIELTAPTGGWPSVVHVALDRQLIAADGTPLTAPVRVTFGG